MDFDKFPVFCINLKTRNDRWERFMSQPGLKKFPQVPQRYYGIVGKTWDLDADKQVGLHTRRNISQGCRRTHHEIVNKNSVAIYHTHVNLWKHLLEKTDAPAIVIMEDDLRIDPDSYEKVKKFMAHPIVQSGDWDMLNLGAWSNKYRKIDDTISALDYSYLFHCYIVSRRGAQRLIERAYPIEMHVDHYAGLMSQLGYIKTYGPVPRIFSQFDPKDSDNSDGTCDVCDIPNRAKQLGWATTRGRMQLYQLEESLIAISLLLGAVYIGKKYFKV